MTAYCHIGVESVNQEQPMECEYVHLSRWSRCVQNDLDKMWLAV